ncbi:Homeodomain-like DNA binding domain-containing transcription factor [Phycomyces blakesleeanus]|uniref:Homeodomain-like DNA binding domain-containing transcription factor n=2 Tax=Phycomyces blakesleeanus TaxID=4837 RepID=A0A167P8S5_PHYB8|nr:Homeodomain-like DNA binding domain-containing transcription factor [Phycomyces blakesleeanus NRRL 1555(-)]OAD77481.1 Homeodomain-like DNA binding domain-containing transcription factor [Phycomyces blakesleeanus NRRL 1555(-)]|eukprot:XP_018295521.1 Homeodomain-like DNA binding domain-containing transcription factor [Phycomyces blakesleeanus NRRL 1555(-)]
MSIINNAGPQPDKKERISLTREQKEAIIEKEDSSNLTLHDLGVWAFEQFQKEGVWKPLSHTTIKRIISEESRSKIKMSAPHQHGCKHFVPSAAPALEDRLAVEAETLKKARIPVNQTTLQRLAIEIVKSDPSIAPAMKFSRGWVQSVMKRKSIKTTGRGMKRLRANPRSQKFKKS